MFSIKASRARPGWLGVLAMLLSIASACAQPVRIGVQTGLGYLPLQVMVHDALLQKQAALLGLSDVKPEIIEFANAGAMNDALLSGSIQYGSGGVSTFLVLWAKASGANEVKSAGSLVAMPMYLSTRNPAIKSVKDFTGKDRIGVAGVKVSYQAMLLQMAAAQAWGQKDFDRLDPLTVTVSNANGAIMLANPMSEVNTHFAPPPFAYVERRTPGVHTVLKSYDILGGPATLNLVWSTVAYGKSNPRIHRAFVAALQEADRAIKSDPAKAAQTYLDVSRDKTAAADIQAQLEDPEIIFSVAPNGVMKVAQFMYDTGTIRKKPARWQDLYFEELHQLPGN